MMKELLPQPIRTVLSSIAGAGRRIAGIDEHRRTFNRIYATDAWNGGSGPGSTPENTEDYRRFLVDFMTSHSVKSVVDVGCGDWQFSQLIDWDGIDYTGLDVSSVVLQNTRRFAKPGIRFAELNGITQDVPGADLLIVKDVMQHWRNEDVCRFLPQLKKFKYALITNVSHRGDKRTNTDIQIGDFRPVDLTAPPFNVPGSYDFEFEAGEQKTTFVWTAK